MTIMLFKPSGVTYTKAEASKNVQAFSGFMGQEVSSYIEETTCGMERHDSLETSSVLGG